MKSFSITAILAGLALVASAAFANESDTICNVQVGSQVVQLDFGINAQTNTLDSVTFTGTDGTKESLLHPGSIFSMSQYQYDQSGLNVQLIDPDGHNIFNLQLVEGPEGLTGWLSAKLSGLDVPKGYTNCPSNP
jgi:hypothetical protein